ncbi:hypothetical protein CAI16_12175 [Virgibacillus dokdonensis]|uniref:Uncharacterized protein n=1 Tax=Virgibacillus dokdonensis TaxID=302167 RepID=A0A3E0WQF1_9BACI|nr:hypothetical protein [Virgibacillus dokdonensis]RFA34237.1 hypothetical protein CAI16_12175 [Virgibacillus dokdonensis]
MSIKRKSSIIVFIITLMVGLFSFSLTTYGAEVDFKAFNVKQHLSNQHVEFNDEVPVLDKTKGVPVKKPASINSNYNVSGDRMFFNDSLVETDPDDFWFFNVSDDRSILFEIETDNPDYVVELYKVDWETETAYPTSISGSPGNIVANSQLIAGDWALRVYSTETMGNNYTIKMNATNPSGAASIISTSHSLLQAILLYPNREVYSNGNYVLTVDGSNSHLDWEREYYFSWDGNYNQRTHSVSDAKVKSIAGPVSYQSDYASSDNAILVYLDKETLFMHHVSSFRSGPPTQYEDSFVDTIGKTTPRRLDDDDLNNWGDHIIVFDVNKGRSIDFFSVLNFYYASGVESIPTIEFLN